MCPQEHPSNIHAAAGFPSTFVNFTSVSETFHQLSVRPQDLPSTSINILSVRGKHFVRKLDLPLNFRQLSVWPRVLLSSFVHQQDLQSSSVNIPCSRGLPSTSINFPCVRETFRELSLWQRGLLSDFCVAVDILSTFFASAQPSVNFRHLSVHPLDLL